MADRLQHPVAVAQPDLAILHDALQRCPALRKIGQRLAVFGFDDQHLQVGKTLQCLAGLLPPGLGRAPIGQHHHPVGPGCSLLHQPVIGKTHVDP